MKHLIKPCLDQTVNPAIDRNDPQAAATAIELEFPKTFSKKAWRVIRYFEGAMYLYAYKGKFVATDESLELTEYGDGTTEAPYGAPRFVCDTLNELEETLEGLADFYDEDGSIPGWETNPYPEKPKQISVGLFPSVMVKLVDSNLFVGVKTYDRAHGSHGRFLISKTTLQQLLDAPIGESRYESDCGDYVKITRLKDTLLFSFAWLNTYGDGNVRGFRQDVTIPLLKVARSALDFSEVQKHLYAPLKPKATIKASPDAAKVIREIANNKKLRRAFSKAMRDCFNWPGDEITLYKDSAYNFYFTTKSGFPKCGGLILHPGTKDGHFSIYYSVHT